MSNDKIPGTFIGACVYVDAMHRLGFEEDDVKVVFGEVLMYSRADSEITMTVQLRLGGAEPAAFTIVVGNIRRVDVAAGRVDAWLRAWNAKSQDRREELFQRYMPVEKFLQLAEAIDAKGVVVPKLAEMRGDSAAAIADEDIN